MVEKKCKNVLTKHRFQEWVLSACRDRDDEWRMSVMGLVEFLRDCGAGKCSHHNNFLLPTSAVGREN